MKQVRLSLLICALGATLALIGCGPDPATSGAQAQSGTAPTPARFVPKAEAGIRIEPADPTGLIAEANKMPVIVRADPFALHGFEQKYDHAQFAAAMVEGNGWYPNWATERQEKQETFQVEAQPPRRLAGILIGETITALIDMGDGKGLQTIRPGQMLPDDSNPVWVVQSIDEEKAILRRVNGETRPKYVVVRLEDAGSMNSSPSGGSGGGTSGGNTRGGNNRGGQANERD